QHEVEDRIVWIHDKGGVFSVKKLLQLLAYGGMEAVGFPFDRIWSLEAPPRLVGFSLEGCDKCDEFCSVCWSVKLTEVDWWGPKDCRLGRKLGRDRDCVWDSPPTGWLKFNVAGVVVEEVVGCGGVLAHFY
ncbi:hypothetical protein Golob_024449, partial [Gossypium lobatum]|nr:hypothetical protein [Gossypium lobatum]